MRWLLLAICCGVVCSVSTAPAEEGEPSLQVKTKATTFNVGDKKAIYCEAIFLKDDLEWYSPSGEKIQQRSASVKRVYVEHRAGSDAGVSFLALMIQRMTLEDTGTYTCKSGDLSDTIDIFVGEKVVMKESEEDYVAEEGNSINLSCQAKGTPVPEIQWYNDSSNMIVESDKYRITYRNKSFTSILRITNLNHMDPGTYICKATQEKISHFAEKACHLTVQHKPIILNEYSEREVYAILDEWKNITCKAKAYPLPVFTWSKHYGNYDEEIKGGTDEFKITTDKDPGTSSVLTLHISNSTIDEQYKCTVENSKGRQNIIFHVSLGNKPDPPNAVSMVAATATNITFEVTCTSCIFYKEDGLAPRPENLTVLGYVFQLVPVMEGYVAPYWVNATEHRFDIADNNGTAFTVEGLDKSTKYHVRVATHNLAGLSDWFYLTENPATTDAATALTTSFSLLILALIVSLDY